MKLALNSFITKMAPTLKAFAAGSNEPPLAKGVLRLYGMRFCPFVYRTRLVLAAKNIPHEVVNIHLKSKPDWFLAKNPEGKVPVLEQDGRIICESLITSDYLNEVYGAPNLWSSDPYEKAQGRMLCEVPSRIISFAVKVFYQKDDTAIDGITKELLTFEKYLKEKTTPYFSGNQPGMVDYMVWPFLEMVQNMDDAGSFQVKISSSASERPQLSAYIERMNNDPIVKKCTVGTDLHVQYLKNVIAGTPDYDLGL